MIKYKYSALDQNNSIVKGQVDAANENEAREILGERGEKPIRLTPAGVSRGSASGLKFKGISSDEIAVFCKQLSIITKSGISIIKGLLMVKNQTDSKKIKDLAEKLHVGIQKGYSLSEALKNSGYRLPLLLVNMVQVGEMSGNLDDIFRKMSSYFENDSRTKKKVKSAMVYPSILISVSISVIVLFTFFILPQLTEVIMDSGGELPLITKIMMDSSHFVANNIVYLALGGAVLVAVYFVGIPYETRRKYKDLIVLKIPVVSGVAKDFLTTRFARTMGVLINTGLSMLIILETLEKVIGNDKVSKGISAARDKINKGESLSSSLEQMAFFDTMVINIIAIGEETGNLGESLLELADYYDEKFETGVSKLISLIEPIFTLGMGAVIAAILLSAMMPMFNMIGGMSGEK